MNIVLETPIIHSKEWLLQATIMAMSSFSTSRIKCLSGIQTSGTESVESSSIERIS